MILKPSINLFLDKILINLPKPTIEPYFILDKMHLELLNNENENVKEIKSNLSVKYFYKDLNEKFKQEFAKNFRTRIANNLSCVLRTYHQCINCNNILYIISLTHFLNIGVLLLAEYIASATVINGEIVNKNPTIKKRFEYTRKNFIW